MPISTNVFVRSTTLLLAVAFLALAAIVGTTIWLVENNNYWFNETTNARVARAAVVNVRNALQDAETSQRGYLLTQEERYLAPYNAAVPELPGFLDRLDGVLAPYPEAEGVAERIRTVTNAKLAELAQTIELTRSGRLAEALAVIRTDQGKEDMDALRTLFTGIIDAADTRTIEGLENQRNGTVALRWVTIIGGLIIFAFVGAAAWTVVTYNREITAARAEVEAANTSLEQRVRERTSDLGRANEEIQRFAYIVTHDLRAPLVNIMGFTSELETSVGELSRYMADKDDDSDPKFADAKLAATEDLPEAITFIRAATRKMDSLINAILKISREGRRQLKPETLDLAEIVKATVNSVQHQIVENGGSVDVDIRVPRLVSDKLSLEQVLGNLLDNAVKYQQPGRPLTLAIRGKQMSGNRVEIEVEDNGRGIAPSDRARVFELFRRAGTQTQPGEGIGLAHVRTMVRSLGGDITLRSELGVGTTFIINLPRDLRSFLGSKSA